MKVYVSMTYGLVALLLVIISLWCTQTMAQATMQQLGLQQHLKQLKKPAVKSINSPDGDIIDCVRISDQPAFDHPLLKNHTIQMRPSILPSGGLYDEDKESSSIPQLWHQNGRCPEDTIPVRRTKKDDVLRASSIERFGKKSQWTIPNPASSHLSVYGEAYEFALVLARGKFYGAKGTINVWNPTVERPYEFSSSQLWVIADAPEVAVMNVVEAGWTVDPDLYGDNKTRLFTYWTSDAFNSTGCYNLLCPGFIQVSTDVALGAAISPISSYGGRQYEITLIISRDPVTRNWWLQFGNLSPPVGYWPASLFQYLIDSADVTEWGGQVFIQNVKNGQHTSTQMGSGHFPEEGFGKGSYIKNIQIVDQSNNFRDPPQGTRIVQNNFTCYHVHYTGNYVYYGGPGRNPNCP